MKKLSFIETTNYLYNSIGRYKDAGYKAGFALERVKYTLKLLDNPQEKIKVIHIAGTSGKGSTVTFITNFLTKQGFKVGSTLSPHLIDIRERVQINGKPISKEKFSDYFSKLNLTFEEVAKSKYGGLTYFEMLMILAFYSFMREQVDYAVIETGLGGTFDASNCIGNINKLCVITKIGKDHTNILGKTIKEIAINKAGIINERQSVLWISSGKISDNIIRQRAKHMESEIFPLSQLRKLHFAKDTASFSFLDFTLENILVKHLANYQLENLSLALATTVLLSIRDSWQIDSNKLRDTIKNFSFSGRFEFTSYKNRDILLDGAHNPQKMKAFINSLKKKFPNQKFKFILSFKEGKDTTKMIKLIQPLASTITITKFSLSAQDNNLKAVLPEDISKTLIENNYKGELNTYKNLETALQHNLANNQTTSETPIIITGSLYLISEFKNKFKF